MTKKMLTEDRCSRAKKLRLALITREMRDRVANGYIVNGLTYPEFQKRWIYVLDEDNLSLLITYTIDMLLTWCVYKEQSLTTTTNFLPTKEIFRGLKQHIIKTRSFRDTSSMSKILDDLHILIQMTYECLPFLSTFEKTFLRTVKRMIKLRKKLPNEAKQHYQTVINQQHHHQISPAQYFDQGLKHLTLATTKTNNRTKHLQAFTDSFITGYIQQTSSSDLEKAIEQMIPLIKPGDRVTRIIYLIYNIFEDPSDDESEAVALLAILTVVKNLFLQKKERI